MNKIIFLFLACFVFASAAAQITMAEKNVDWITIGQLKSLGTTKAKMEYRLAGSDTIFFLLMKDFKKQEEPNYFSVKFRSTDNTFGKLYELLKSFFLAENKKNKDYSQTFRLGDDMVHLQYHMLITGKGVMFTTKEGYINFTEKDIDKLFGKR